MLASLIGLRSDHHLDTGLVAGIALVWMAGRIPRSCFFVVPRVGAHVGGAALVAAAMPRTVPWMRAFAFAVLLVGIPRVEASDRSEPQLTAPAILIALAGIYACVPDTESIRVLLGAAVPALGSMIAVSARPLPGLGSLGALAVWAAVLGGRGRPGSVVAGAACLGILYLVPKARERRYSRVALLQVLSLDLLLVGVVTRMVGTIHSAWVAALWSVVLLVAARLTLGAIGRADQTRLR